MIPFNRRTVYLYTINLILCGCLISPCFSQGGGSAGGAGAGGGAGAAGGGGASAGTPPSASSAFILKLDGKTSNIQGIPFDIPVPVQLYSNDSIQAIKINLSYWTIPNCIYRKNLENGSLKVSSKLFRHLDQQDIQTIPLGIYDTFQRNTDPSGVRYLMNIAQPVYFTSNTHYLFTLAASITTDKANYPAVRNAIGKFIVLHKNLISAAPGLVANETNLQHDINNILDDYKTNPRKVDHDDSVAKVEWATIKQACDPDDLDDAINSYKGFYPNLSDPLGTIPKIQLQGDPDSVGNLYQVYGLALSLTKTYDSALTQLSNVVTFTKADCVANQGCFEYMLHRLADCRGCCCNASNGPDPFNDTTSLERFIISLVDAGQRNSLFTLLNDEGNQLQILIGPSDKQGDANYLTKITTIRDRLQWLKDKIIGCVIPDDEHIGCKPACLDYLTNIIGQLTANIEIYKAVQRLLKGMDKIIAADGHFLTLRIYGGDSYVNTFTTRFGFKVTADIGIIEYGINGMFPGYSYNPERIVPYFGIHINWRYVNNDAQFRNIPHNNVFSGRHFSTFVGFTVFSVKETGKITNLFSSSALLLGLGYRITPAFRVVVGALTVKKLNPDPLILNTTLGVIPFAGLSFDFNTIFSNMTALLK